MFYYQFNTIKGIFVLIWNIKIFILTKRPKYSRKTINFIIFALF